MSFDTKEPLMRYENHAGSSGVWPLQRRPTNNPAYEDDEEDSAPMRTHVCTSVLASYYLMIVIFTYG
jgi:hypothetical protein